MTIKEHIKRIPLVGDVAQKLYVLYKRGWRFEPSYWIPLLLSERQGVVVQIGSNDGRTGDPLHNWLKASPGWSAVFVEPVPFLFDRLKENYSGDQRFAFENVLINDGSNVPFYWVSEDAKSAIPDLPSWYDQLGGFSRDHITDHIPELDPFIKSASLSGITLTNLFDRHRLDRIDLLHIDTEGADFQILKQLDLKRFRPRVILYERKHLSQDEEESSIRFLQAHYALFNLGADILAVNKEAVETIHVTLKPIRNLRVAER